MIPRHKPNYVLLATTIFLVIFGFLMILSATALESIKASDPAFFLKRQFIYVAIGFLALAAGWFIDYTKIKKYTGLILIAASVLLVSVFIPGLSKSASGATRWIDLGFFSFQPSEVVKILLTFYLADALSRRPDRIKQAFKGYLPLLLVVGLFCLLILIQPDLGTVLVIGANSLLMLFVAGINPVHIFLLLLPVVPAVFLISYTSPYRWARLTAFMNPWKDPKGAGYHIIQSLVAIGSGGLFGFGAGNSRQKFLYLPEQYTDFIFSIICEELGFVGALVLIALYFVLIGQAIKIAISAKEEYPMLLASGLAGYIGIQAFLNIAVATSIVPTTGIPLPLVSYGGTSLITTMFAIGVLLNISSLKKEAK